jgi:hypothetical protein
MSTVKVRQEIKIYDKSPDDYTYEWRDNRLCLHAWGVYPSSSVLAGQPCKKFIDHFDSVEQLVELYPEAESSRPDMQPKNTFDHLPDDHGDVY